MRYALLQSFLVCCALLLPGSVLAQEITQNQALNFGVFAVAKNATVSSIVVTPDNETYADQGIVIGQDGQRGFYTLTGLPPNVSFFLGVEVPNPPSEGGVVLDDATLASSGSGPSFTLEDLTISNGGVLQSDNQGDAVLFIGGTLRTTGTGQGYTGGIYSGTYNLTIYY